VGLSKSANDNGVVSVSNKGQVKAVDGKLLLLMSLNGYAEIPDRSDPSRRLVLLLLSNLLHRA